MDPDTINCAILRIYVDKNNDNSKPCHLAANYCKCKGMGVKKNFLYKNKRKRTRGWHFKLFLTMKINKKLSRCYDDENNPEMQLEQALENEMIYREPLMAGTS